MPTDCSKQFDSCPTHGLRKQFNSGNLVLWFRVFHLCFDYCLILVYGVHMWSDCCVIQAGIIRFYTTQSAQVPIIQNNSEVACEVGVEVLLHVQCVFGIRIRN